MRRPLYNIIAIASFIVAGYTPPASALSNIAYTNPEKAASYPVSPHPILSNLKVRQAVAYCTNRRALAEAVYPTFTPTQIDSLMMDSFLPSSHWAYSKPTTQYPFDPAQGQALLDQAGWTLPNGATYRVNTAGEPLAIKLTTTTASFRYTWAELLEQQLLACGIQLLRLHAPASWTFNNNAGFSRRDYELAGFSWVGEDEYDVIGLYGCNSIPSEQNGWQGQNFNGWCNQIASQAAVQAGNTQLSQVSRKPYFAAIQEEFAKDMPSLPLFVRDDGINLEHIDFNFDSAPPPTPALKEIKVRQAIAYCTDRRALAQAAYPTFTEPQISALLMDSFLPNTHWAYSQPTIQYPFNTTQGKALLDQTGWILPNGATYRTNAAGEPLALKLTTTTASIRYAWAEVFEQQMLVCGIQVLRLHAPASWVFSGSAGFQRRDFELGGFAWIDDNTPFAVDLYGCNSIPARFNNWQGRNYMGWCNQAASQAAVQADNTQLSQADRKPYFTIVQEEFAKDIPSLPLFLRDDGVTWEHIDFNMFTPSWYVYLPAITR